MLRRAWPYHCNRLDSISELFDAQNRGNLDENVLTAKADARAYSFKMSISSIGYKMMWKSSERFGSLVPQTSSSRGRSSLPANADFDEEDDGVPTFNHQVDEDDGIEMIKALPDLTSKKKRGPPKFDALVLGGENGLPLLFEEINRMKINTRSSKVFFIYQAMSIVFISLFYSRQTCIC